MNPKFGERLMILTHHRGLSRRVALDLYLAGDPDLLRQLEDASGEQIAEVNRLHAAVCNRCWFGECSECRGGDCPCQHPERDDNGDVIPPDVGQADQ